MQMCVRADACVLVCMSVCVYVCSHHSLPRSNGDGVHLSVCVRACVSMCGYVRALRVLLLCEQDSDEHTEIKVHFPA